MNTTKERALMDLCLEIARGNIGGERFNQLLIATGILLDEHEWDAANRLIGHSEVINHLSELSPAAQ